MAREGPRVYLSLATFLGVAEAPALPPSGAPGACRVLLALLAVSTPDQCCAAQGSAASKDSRSCSQRQGTKHPRNQGTLLHTFVYKLLHTTCMEETSLPHAVFARGPGGRRLRCSKSAGGISSYHRAEDAGKMQRKGQRNTSRGQVARATPPAGVLVTTLA